MTVRTARNRDVSIAYETFGPADGEPLLLIMGLDYQMVWWPEGFCHALTERGFRVARFDNRDAGLSTHFSSPRKENPFRVLIRGSRRPAYTTVDMVDDGVAVMNALGWTSAHVFGASMGSALALATAVLRPHRVRSVTAAMGGPLRAIDTLRYLKYGMFLRAARIKHPDTDEGAVRTMVDLTRLLASPHHPFDEDWARSVAEISHSRSPRDPGTTARQTYALRAAGALTARLSEITVPTLVINGADDPLIRPSAAGAIARLIPGARHLVYPGMGHLLQQHLWVPIADEVGALARPEYRRETRGETGR